MKFGEDAKGKEKKNNNNSKNETVVRCAYYEIRFNLRRVWKIKINNKGRKLNEEK